MATVLENPSKLRRTEQQRFHLATLLLFYQGAIDNNVRNDFDRWDEEEHDMVVRVVDFLEEISAAGERLGGFGIDLLCEMLAGSVGLRADAADAANLVRLLLSTDGTEKAGQVSKQVSLIMAVERMSWAELKYLRGLLFYGRSKKSRHKQHAFFMAMMQKGVIRVGEKQKEGEKLKKAAWDRMEEIERISKSIMGGGSVRSNVLHSKSSFRAKNNTELEENEFLGRQIARILANKRDRKGDVTEEVANGDCKQTRSEDAGDASEDGREHASENRSRKGGKEKFVFDPQEIAKQVGFGTIRDSDGDSA